MQWFIALLFGVAVVFQVFVTIKLWRIDWYERAEKIAQSKLIWLIPIIGAVAVYSVIVEEDEPRGPTSHLRG
jgi:hypothetical protein